MKNAALLLCFVFLVSVVANDLSLLSSLRKSYKTCVDTGSFDEETVKRVSKHEDPDNRQVNCLRGCILFHSGLINENAVFNATKFKELISANKRLDAMKVEIITGMADICVKLDKQVTDKCKVAEKYLKCFLIMISI